MIGNPLKISDLISEIERKELLLPEIQRGYVWQRQQAVKLIDSLYREYPTGTLLLWDTEELPVTKEMEKQKENAGQPNFRPKIVLDGQQRLTTLYKVFVNDSSLRIYFNLETEVFQLYAPSLRNQPLWIPISDVLAGKKSDYAILMQIQKALGLTPDDPKNELYLARLQKLRKIQDYKYPIEIFKNDDYEEVTELFIRINSGGTPLREAELALARLAWRLPGTITDTFEKALEEYEGFGFYFDTSFLMRCLIAVATGQSRFRYLSEFWKRDDASLRRDWERTKQGLDTAVNFIRTNARLESSEWLPSLNALIPLVAYFQGRDSIAPGAERKLLYWFYLVSMRGRYSGSVETALDQDLRALRSPEPIASLISNCPIEWQRPLMSEDFEGAGTRSPLFMMCYVVTRKNGAKDWFTGIDLSTDLIGDAYSIEFHHIFPRALLRERGVDRYKRDEIANLAFLAQKANRKISKAEPLQYLSQIDPERLRAQFVPTDKTLWELDRFEDFLCVRRRLLAEAINNELKSLQE